MGDVAMSVPVVKAFLHQYPSARITFVSKPFLAPLFEDISNVTFYGADVTGKHKGFLGLFRLFKELKKLNITHIADLHNVLRSKVLRSFFSFSGYKTAFIDKGRAEKKALTRTNNKVFKQLKTTHQRYADVFSSLGFKIDLSNPKKSTPLELSKNVFTISGSKNEPWIGIAPFAAFDSKAYPLPLIKEVIAKISNTHCKIFLFGGGSKEIDILNDLEKTFKNTINVAGKLTLKEELTLISHLNIMVSMDSGNAHFAAMLGVKTITLWGVTHPFAGFAPFNQPRDYCVLPDLNKYPNIPCSVYGNKVCAGYENVMETIDPSIIFSLIENTLEQ
ncbi:MAG: glycosyltransferase family 9 protein [Flavobacteriaceae bacterium]